MRIINLIQKPQLRGAEIFACQLSNHLLDHGDEVLLVSIFKGDSTLPFKGKQYHLNRSLEKRFFDLSGWKKFSQIINSFKPDIVQANAADTLKFAVSSKICYHWESAIVFRNANKMGDFINSKLKWGLNQFYLSKVDYVISVSKECEKDLRKTFSYSEQKINTVEIGVEEYTLGEVPEDLIHIFSKGPVIAHIGGFVPEKNHEELIDIFFEIQKEKKNLQLLLLGKGRLQPKIVEKVKRKNLSKSVHFLGYRNDVLDILHNSTVFVLPSLIEGLPGVILEAMYAKTPVIAYNVGGIGEIVKSNTGWLIKKRDKAGFKNSLIEVLENPNLVESKVSEAKKMITEKFQNNIISKRFRNSYKQIIKRNTSGGDFNRMRILQLVTRRQYRGAELFAADLSTELLRLGHEVTFVGIYESKDDILRVEGADNRDLITDKRSAFSIEVTRKLIKLIKEIKPDVVQCNGSDTLKYMFAASYFTKDIPVVYRNISIISEWISNSSKKMLYKNMFRKIAYVTSVGDEAMADFIKTYNYPATRAEVIRRGIPIKSVDKKSLYQQLRKDLQFSPDTKIALHIGNFSPEKNHKFLIDAFEDLAQYSHIKLVCVGNGLLLDKIRALIKERKLQKNIILLGFRKDIPELLAASDCLVLSSKVEGVPGVVLEAGTQKIPTVAIDVGGVSEVLINEQTGYLIKDFNKEEFKQKLLRLLENDKLRQKMGENAFNMISKGFDPSKNAKKFEALYRNLINTDESLV